MLASRVNGEAGGTLGNINEILLFYREPHLGHIITFTRLSNQCITGLEFSRTRRLSLW